MINDFLKIISNQQAQRLTLKGKTIKYNNLAITLNNSNWLVYSGSGTFANNRLSVVGAVGRDGFRIRDSSIFLNLVNGHKYFKRFWLKNSVEIQFYCVNPNNYSADNNGRYINEIEEYTRTDNADKNCDLFPYTSGQVGNIEFGDFIVIDLTLLFGANNEPSTLAEFYATDLGKAIQNGYYPPCTTENKIVSITSPLTFKNDIFRVFTLQDKAEETLSNIGSVKASCKNGILTINGQANSYDYQDYKIAYYENAPLKANHKYFIESKVFSGTGRPFNIVINEPYREVGGTNVSEMIWDCTNPQYLIFRIRGENVNYQNFVAAPIIIDLTEEYGSGNEPTTFEDVKKGWAYRNYFFNDNLVYTRTKRVDLGTLNWNSNSGTFPTNVFYNTTDIDVKVATQLLNYSKNLINSMYISSNGKIILTTKENYSSASAIKQALNGVILEYETAEPLELNGFNNDKNIDLGELGYNVNVGTFPSRSFYTKTKFTDAINIKNVNMDLITLIYFDNSHYLIVVTNATYNSEAELKQALSGNILTYETNTPSVYDTFENHSGKVVRKIGKIKLNDATINYSGGRFLITLNDIESWEIPNQPSENIKVAEYKTIILSDLASNDVCIVQSGNLIILKDTQYTSVSALKSAKGNVVIYYELATPTTENERSVLVDHRYTKVVDANEIEIDTD